jgi:hypothetical protein
VCDTGGGAASPGDAAPGEERQAPAAREEEQEEERAYKVHTDLNKYQAEQRVMESKGALLRATKDGVVVLTAWHEASGTVKNLPVKISRARVTLGAHEFPSLRHLMAAVGVGNADEDEL